MKRIKRIVFISSEAVPFAKSGGLADVSGALPAALKKLGVEVSIILPLYRTVKEKGFPLVRMPGRVHVPLGSDTLSAAVYKHITTDGPDAYFLDREEFFDRRGLYGTEEEDYFDNLERFTFFSHCALQLIDGLIPAPDILHCHDWQTGLVPALRIGPFSDKPLISRIPVLFTIHNLGYQGIFPAEKFSLTGLEKDRFFTMEALEYWGKISLLKAGILFADAVTTVSPTYSKEILTPQYGKGMEGILQKRAGDLHGILNGVDYMDWDPETDRYLPSNYGPESLAGKMVCKRELLNEIKINGKSVEKPLLAMVSRLDNQKGIDLVLKILDDLLKQDLSLLILGSGGSDIVGPLKAAAKKSKGRLVLKTGFDEGLAHRIMGGADIFLMPSRYEPCGLTQMYALKYGTIPVVRATGGLEDTVKQFDRKTGKGNGFKFIPYEAGAFLRAVKDSLKFFNDPSAWKGIQENAMSEDFSWARSAKRYMSLYKSLI